MNRLSGGVPPPKFTDNVSLNRHKNIGGGGGSLRGAVKAVIFGNIWAPSSKGSLSAALIFDLLPNFTHWLGLWHLTLVEFSILEISASDGLLIY